MVPLMYYSPVAPVGGEAPHLSRKTEAQRDWVHELPPNNMLLDVVQLPKLCFLVKITTSTCFTAPDHPGD